MSTSLRVLIIVPNDTLRLELAQELKRFPDIEITRSLAVFPDLEELLRSIRIHNPDLLFAGVEEVPKIDALLASVDELMPGLQTIAVARHADAELVHRLMHIGVREYLTSPITHDRLAEALDFVKRYLKKHSSKAARQRRSFFVLSGQTGRGHLDHRAQRQLRSGRGTVRVHPASGLRPGGRHH